MQTTDTSNFFRSEAELELEDARKLKDARTKDLGSPIQLPSKPLAIVVQDCTAWVAESGFVVRAINLETSEQRAYKGHTGPVSCLGLFRGPQLILLSGSWDKTIRIWNISTRKQISCTSAHSDFVKALLVVPELNLIVSGGADKIIRFWDFSKPDSPKPLQSIGSISAHTRPIQCLAAAITSANTGRLYTADSMGVVKIWEVERSGNSVQCRIIQDLVCHRTAINDMWYREGELWTASSDEKVQWQYDPPREGDANHAIFTIEHPKPAKVILPLIATPLHQPYLIVGFGELLRVYAISSGEQPEFLSEVDVHWHDVTAIGFWIRKVGGSSEAWIVTASLDGTVRRWKLADLVNPSIALESYAKIESAAKPKAVDLTAEEEEELAELMDSD